VAPCARTSNNQPIFPTIAFVFDEQGVVLVVAAQYQEGSGVRRLQWSAHSIDADEHVRASCQLFGLRTQSNGFALPRAISMSQALLQRWHAITMLLKAIIKCALCTLWGGFPVRGSGRPAAAYLRWYAERDKRTRLWLRRNCLLSHERYE
jgi:hypothetical protein